MCENLGIDEYIVQSPRQKNQKPSPAVLAGAVSAIVGAVWKDLEEQNRSVTDTLNRLSEILCHLDAVSSTESEDRSLTIDEAVAKGNDGVHCSISGERSYPNVDTLDFRIEQLLPENQYEDIVNVDSSLYLPPEIQFESEFTLQDFVQDMSIFNA